MKRLKLFSVLMVLVLVLPFITAAVPTYAENEKNVPASVEAVADEVIEDEEDSTIGTKAMAAALVVGIAAATGAVAMAMAISKSAESMARQPEAAGKINSAMMLGLVFIETLIIYALIVAILIIFVL